MSPTPVPRIRCHGRRFEHDPAFLALRQADPLTMECPVCTATVRVEE